MTNRILLASSLIFSLGAFAACDDDDDDDGGADAGTAMAVEETDDIVLVAAETPELTTFVAALQKANLIDELQGTGPFTVFAPSNAAFAALFQALGRDLNALSSEELAPILNYHVVAGELRAANLTTQRVATTVNGSDVRITSTPNGVVLTAGNGNANVAAADIDASNGVIHVIDRVMLPPPAIPAVVAANPELSVLTAALQKAGLVTTLAGPGPFTVFAPTNNAFAVLLASNPAWNTLDDIPADTLITVLNYHVVPGKFYSETLVTLPSVNTLLQRPINISVNTGAVILNGTARVIGFDGLASNGVIHSIDQVLIPPAN